MQLISCFTPGQVHKNPCQINPSFETWVKIKVAIRKNIRSLSHTHTRVFQNIPLSPHSVLSYSRILIQTEVKRPLGILGTK